MAFALGRSRDYMMRSEKRTGSGGTSGSGNRRPPRRKRRAGFFYMLFTILLSLIFWPIGMIMLWRRKVRWTVGAKLVFSLISLFVCIFLIVFALTVPTGNDDITRVQDNINDFLDNATTSIAAGYDIAYEKGGEVLTEMADFAEAGSAWAVGYIADGIDALVDLTGKGKDFVAEKIEALTSGDVSDTESADAPDASSEPEIQKEPEVSAAPTATDAPEASAEPADEEAPGTSTEPETTSTPETEPVQAATDNISLQLPEGTPDPATATALEAGTLTSDGDLQPGVTPEAAAEATATAEPTPTAEPTATPEPVIEVEVKNPGEAVVYFNMSGTCYHMASSCKNMSTASESTLAEAVAAGKIRCRTCGTPEGEILQAENVIWTDESNTAHTTNDCAAFEGKWGLMNLEDAVEAEYNVCEECQAHIHCKNLGIILPTPTPEPTATPEPTVVTPAASLKPVGEATVYHSSNGSYYHRFNVCKGMSGSSPYTLQECVDGNYKRCRNCDAPLPELIDETCLWVDENEACHTTDECSLFSGNYTLIPRDEALENGLSGCIECSADEYLQPNTVIG